MHASHVDSLRHIARNCQAPVTECCEMSAQDGPGLQLAQMLAR
jgi:hypothetical protein